MRCDNLTTRQSFLLYYNGREERDGAGSLPGCVVSASHWVHNVHYWKVNLINSCSDKGGSSAACCTVSCNLLSSHQTQPEFYWSIWTQSEHNSNSIWELSLVFDLLSRELRSFHSWHETRIKWQSVTNRDTKPDVVFCDNDVKLALSRRCLPWGVVLSGQSGLEWADTGWEGDCDRER